MYGLLILIVSSIQSKIYLYIVVTNIYIKSHINWHKHYAHTTRGEFIGVGKLTA